MGDYTMDQLYRMTQRLQERRMTIDDPDLLAIIDDIELRVRVELAKYGV